MIFSKKPEIIDNRYPPKRWDDYTESWGNLKLGVMLCYGMTTYTASDRYNDNRYIFPPSISTFNVPNDIIQKSKDWIDDLNNTNDIDYYILATGHHIGYRNYISSIELPAQTVTDAFFGSIQLPMRSDYFYSKQQFLDGMVNKCKDLGKPFFLYYNIGRRVNDRGSDNYGDQGIYEETTFLRLRELIIKYKPYGLWLDATGEAPWNINTLNSPLQKLYSRLKNVDNNIHITINFSSSQNSVYDGNGDTLFWTADNFSLERQLRSWSDSSEYQPLKLFQDIKYYINNEDLTSNNTDSYYFGAPDRSPTWLSQSAVQAYYDAAKANGIPYAINVSPSRAGVLGSNQLDLLSNLVL